MIAKVQKGTVNFDSGAIMKPIISVFLATIITLFGFDSAAMGQSIKVGVVTPLTGRSASIGNELKHGYDIAVEVERAVGDAVVHELGRVPTAGRDHTRSRHGALPRIELVVDGAVERRIGVDEQRERRVPFDQVVPSRAGLRRIPEEPDLGPHLAEVIEGG